MKIFYLIFFAVISTCYAASSNIQNEQAEYWKSVARTFSKDQLLITRPDCDAKDTQGNKTCLACITNTKLSTNTKTACITVTPRLTFRELYIELLINGSYDASTQITSGQIMLLQEIIRLDNATSRPARKDVSASGFGDPGVRAFPINIIQRLNGRVSMKFCVEAVTGNVNGGGYGGRWCFKYNGETLKGFSAYILMGTTHHASHYTPVEYNTRKNSGWEPIPFNDITP